MEENSLKELKDALDESSKHNGKLLLSFLVFAIYILLTVVTTSDMNLLMPESKLKLPIVNIDLSLMGFYFVAPLLLIIFHYNLLFNMLRHSIMLYEWIIKRGTSSDNKYPFPFTFNFIFTIEKNIDFYLLKTSIWLTLYLGPLLIFFYIQRKISAYHSLTMTSVHTLFVVLDAFIIFLYWHRIMNPALTNGNGNNFSEIFKHHMNKGLLCNCKLISSLFKRQAALEPTSRRWIKYLAATFTPLIFWLILLFSFTNLFILIYISSTDGECMSSVKDLIPHLDLRQKILVMQAPSEEVIQHYLTIGKDKEDAWYDYTLGLNLRGRDLKFANFDSAVLINADLSGAQLQGTSMWGVQLQKANLFGADLRKAQLHEAKLRGAILADANLNSAYLSGADLMGVDFEGATLQGASLYGVSLLGANLAGVQLQGSNLLRAQLPGADLRQAKLQGANLQLAGLQGADLGDAHLQGAYLFKTDVSCANLTGIDSAEGLIILDSISKTDISWDKFLNHYTTYIPEEEPLTHHFSPRAEFIKRIKAAKVRCRQSKDLVHNFKNNFDKFKTVRLELACTDVNIAERLLDHSLTELKNSLDMDNAILEYTKSKCSHIYSKIYPYFKRTHPMIYPIKP